MRTSSTFSPFSAAATARSALRYTLPQAAPGPAGRPVAMAAAFLRSAASNTGARSCSSWSAGLRRTAVCQSMSFSLTMSMENLSAAMAVRLPLRVWSM